MGPVSETRGRASCGEVAASWYLVGLLLAVSLQAVFNLNHLGTISTRSGLNESLNCFCFPNLGKTKVFKWTTGLSNF